MGSSLETADTSPGTRCRISHVLAQMNYPVLALCCNMRTELSHSGRDVGRGQVFPHPCAEDSCLVPRRGRRQREGRRAWRAWAPRQARSGERASPAPARFAGLGEGNGAPAFRRAASKVFGETSVLLWGIFLVVSVSQLLLTARANYANVCTACWSASSQDLLLCPVDFTVVCLWRLVSGFEVSECG